MHRSAAPVDGAGDEEGHERGRSRLVLAGVAHFAHLCDEPIWIKTAVRIAPTEPVELMFPPGGFRKLVGPFGVWPVDHPEVPGRHLELRNKPPHFASDESTRIPEVLHSVSTHELDRVGNVLLFGTQIGCRDDEQPDIGLICGLKGLGDFGDPPKTDSSRGSHEQDGSWVSSSFSEGGLEGLHAAI